MVAAAKVRERDARRPMHVGTDRAAAVNEQSPKNVSQHKHYQGRRRSLVALCNLITDTGLNEPTDGIGHVLQREEQGREFPNGSL